MACLAFGIAIFATGCKKDEVKETFNLNAVIEEVKGTQKVHMENLLPVWDNNDTIRVNSENCTVSITGSGSSRTNSIAKEEEEATYCAVYPARYLTNANADITSARNISITLPRRQEYKVSGGNQTVRMPMIAYSGNYSTDLYFKNLCSVLKVTVTNNTGHTFKLDSIEVTSDGGNLCGTGSVTLSGFTNSNTPAGLSLSGTGADHKVTLCGANKTSMEVSFATNASKTFYIVVPTVATANLFRFRLGIEEGFLINKKTTNSWPVDRNKLITMTFAAQDFEQPIDVILGPFTVDEYGTQVSFSTGNLWWDKTTGKYKLEAQQHYYQPSVNTDAETHISHFWWKKDILPGYTTNPADQPQSVNEWLFTNDPLYTNQANRSFEVEGTYQNAPATAKGKFRVLTDDEWEYLIEGRYNDHLLNTTYSVGAAIVTLTDVIPLGLSFSWPISGIVIIPDGSSVEPATLTTLAAINAAGAVFLPVAGGRFYPSTPPFTYNDCWFHSALYPNSPYYDAPNPVGDYWTSNILRVDKARTFTFGPSGSYVHNASYSGLYNGGFSTWGDGTRTIGRTIRLVCKYVAPRQ